MRTFETDRNNDFVIGPDGNFSMISGINAVAQESRHFAATVAEEMIHAIDEGIPYLDDVFTRQPNMALIDSRIRQRLLQVDTVIGIEKLNVVLDGETLKYTATLKTTNGNVEING